MSALDDLDPNSLVNGQQKNPLDDLPVESLVPTQEPIQVKNTQPEGIIGAIKGKLKSLWDSDVQELHKWINDPMGKIQENVNKVLPTESELEWARTHNGRLPESAQKKMFYIATALNPMGIGGALIEKPVSNQPIDQTITESLKAGYKIPPAMVNPTLKNRILTSVAGKESIQQMASNANQEVTDALARKAAGLAKNEPITPETLQAARQALQAPYKEIGNIGYNTSSYGGLNKKTLQPDLNQLTEIRNEANRAWKQYNTDHTASALGDYHAARAAENSLENKIEMVLNDAGRPDLMAKFKQARIALAKNHNVEEALIEGGGTVDSRVIARALQRGDPLSEELATIGKFSNNFPKVSQPYKLYGQPDVHNLKSVSSLLMGGGGMAAAGPVGATAGAIPWLAPIAARKYLLSKGIQKGLMAGQKAPMYVYPYPVQTASLISQLIGENK